MLRHPPQEDTTHVEATMPTQNKPLIVALTLTALWIPGQADAQALCGVNLFDPDPPTLSGGLRLETGGLLDAVSNDTGAAMRFSGDARGCWRWGGHRGIPLKVKPGGMSLELGGSGFGLSALASADGIYRPAEKANPWQLAVHGRLQLDMAYFSVALLRTEDRPGRFDDWFWRPRRGLTTTGVEVTMPAMLAFLLDSDTAIIVGNFRANLGVVVDENAPARPDGRQDAASSVDMVTISVVVSRDPVPLSVSILSLGLNASDIPLPSTTGEKRSLSVMSSHIHFVDISGFRLTERITLDLALGLGILDPASVATASDPLSPPTVEDRPPLREISVFSGHFGTNLHLSSTTLGARLSTFERLDPSGFGADYGARTSLDIDHDLSETLSVGASFDAVAAQRLSISNEAAAFGVALDPVGTRYLMGRAQLDMSFDLLDHLAFKGSLWAERSDRDDPFLTRDAPTAQRTAFGTWWSLEASF